MRQCRICVFATWRGGFGCTATSVRAYRHALTPATPAPAHSYFGGYYHALRLQPHERNPHRLEQPRPIGAQPRHPEREWSRHVHSHLVGRLTGPHSRFTRHELLRAAGETLRSPIFSHRGSASQVNASIEKMRRPHRISSSMRPANKTPGVLAEHARTAALRYAKPDPERSAVVPRRGPFYSGHSYRSVIETLSFGESPYYSPLRRTSARPAGHDAASMIDNRLISRTSSLGLPGPERRQMA